MKSKGGLQVWAEGKQAVGEMAEQGRVRSGGIQGPLSITGFTYSNSSSKLKNTHLVFWEIAVLKDKKVDTPI